ncbi:MAG: hypothetical protein PF447_02885 [Spirochaetaceae bacterium]|jgi:hypothetical protein|nr:hypothetical protein [Spirochaetaceae bacterium]
MKIKFLPLIFYYLFFGGIFSLTSQETSEAFSPFPSQLRTYPNGLETILIWRDSKDLQNEKYAIFRSTNPIDEDYINSSDPIALVDKGIMIYTDTPDETGDVYYAIICKDSNRTYPIILPYRNSTAKPVVIDAGVFHAERAAKIRDLQWEIIDEQIALSFQSDQVNRKYGVYRSTLPINELSDLDRSTLIRILQEGQTYYLDSPIPGIPYYYAVVDYQLFLSRDKSTLYEGNRITQAISLPLNQYLQNKYWDMPQRQAPLPDIRLERFFSDIHQGNIILPRTQSISPETEERLNSLVSPFEKPEVILEPTVLSMDNAESVYDHQQRLQEVLLRGTFTSQEWQKAYDELLLINSDINDRHFNARIFYYTGQCKYFLGQLEEAYLNFSLSAIYYPLESKVWMDVILKKL